LYLSANYDYLRGFRYENIDLSISLDTDRNGQITLLPTGTPLVINRRDSTEGNGFAIDVGVAAVLGAWEVGFGANGIANRIDWTNVEQTRYSFDNLLSGDSNLRESATIPVADTRVELPVDYRGSLAYRSDVWSAAVEAGHGFGGGSFHGGAERRLGRIQLRGGARYTTEKWNPTGGVGFDLSEHVSLDVAAFGTNAN